MLHLKNMFYNISPKKNNIQTIIDLPQKTFRPFCGVKNCLVIVQKNQGQQKNIMMGVVEQASWTGSQDHNHK